MQLTTSKGWNHCKIDSGLRNSYDAWTNAPSLVVLQIDHGFSGFAYCCS